MGLGLWDWSYRGGAGGMGLAGWDRVRLAGWDLRDGVRSG